MTKVSKNPLISIIVPVYNAEKYLDECVESIVNQTYKNIEIILVDDGSQDNSSALCNQWSKKDKRIKTIHKKNGGVSSARNIGISDSKGEWVSFVDADDWIEKDYIKEMIEKANAYNCEYVCCGFNRVYSNRVEHINSNEKIIEHNSNTFLKSLLNVQNSYGFVHMKLIKKSLIDKIRFDENIKVGEDALFNVQLCKRMDKIVIYNKALYNYRLNLDSVVRKYDIDYVDKYTKSMNTMKKYINANYQEKNITQMLYNYIAYHVMLICVNYCYHPENKSKYKSLKEVCKMDIYKDAIKNSNYEDLSLTRKITLFTLKFRMFFLTALICKFRQMQFRKQDNK